MNKYSSSFNSKRPRRRTGGVSRRRGTTVGSRVHRRTRSANLRPISPGMPDLRRSQGFGRRAPRRSTRKRLPYAVIAIGCALLLFVASIVWYLNRDVTITLNGEEVNVRIGSTIDQLIESQQLTFSPGDLLAVDDTVLERDAGEEFSATLNGEKLSGDAVHSTQLNGGEALELADGEDVYEEHDVEATEIQPTVTVMGTGAVQYVKTWGVPGRSEVWTGAQSGKTADRGVVQEVQNCEVVATSVTPDGGGKYIALTFDEGPSSYTEQILQILEEKDVKATFFLLGSSTDERQASAKAIADAGHQVGSASYSNEDLTAMDSEALRAELQRGFSSVSNATGVQTTLLRAPSGAFGVEQWAAAMDLVSVNVTWNVDSGDWLLPGAETVADTVVKSASNGNIILLTDNEAMQGQTVEALPEIIDRLREQGYEFVTVSELLDKDESIPKDLVKQTVEMPEGAVLPHVSLAAGQAEE